MTRAHTTGHDRHLRGTRRVLVVCAAVFGLALSAGCGAKPSQTAGSATSQPAKVTQISALPAIDPVPCDPGSAAAGETVTRGRGDYSSGVSVVAAYHWAVITARDSARAAEAVAPGNPMARPELITEALSGFPPGTTYCLRLRQTNPTTVLFTLTYKPPAGDIAEYRMRATVTGSAGAARMTGEVAQ